MDKFIIILMVCSSLCFATHYNKEHGDSIYAAYLREVPIEQQPEPYYINCVIRYSDIAYQEFTCYVLWHYYVAQTGKYRIIPVDGRPFQCDNVIIKR